jgi:hypothetical protein
MIPWLWFWSPQYHFPFSGSVAQRIEPDTNWFFAGIRPEAGNGEVEKEIFDTATYGRQLGLISEVLLAMAGSQKVSQEQASESLQRLEEIYCEVETVKSRRKQKLSKSATDVLEKLRASDPAELERVLARFARPQPQPPLLRRP